MNPPLTHTKKYPFGAKVPKYIFFKSKVKFEKITKTMPNLMKIANKKAKIKISKNEGYFFGQHSLVEKSPPATDRYWVETILAAHTAPLSSASSTSIYLAYILVNIKIIGVLVLFSIYLFFWGDIFGIIKLIVYLSFKLESVRKKYSKLKN